MDDHVQALKHHVGELFPLVLANDHLIAPSGLNEHLVPVALPSERPADYELVLADVIDETHPWRHDADKLAQAVMQILAKSTA